MKKALSFFGKRINFFLQKPINYLSDFKQLNHTRTLSLFLTALFFTAVSQTSNAQCNLLNENFNSNPALSNTNVDGAWYPDRYRPAAFISDVLGGGNVLKISIDGTNDGLASRPSGYNSSFYNTQGRKINQCGSCVTVAKGDLWIPSSWETSLRRSDIWATAFNGSNAISAYPIIGFRNVTGSSPGIYYYDVNTNSFVNSGVSISYDNWYTLEMKLSGTDLVYLVNNNVVGTISSNGSTYLGNIIMQAYNFNDNSLAYYNSDSYDAYWDNIKTTGTNGNAVININTGETFCTIQRAIDDAETLDGHTLSVSAGSYTEAITVNKALTIKGANNGIAGTGSRTSESTLENCSVNVSSNGVVVLDGFYFHQTNNTVDVVLLSGGSQATVENCIFRRDGITTGNIVRAIATSAGSGAKVIQNNYFTGDASGGLFGSHKTWNNGLYINGASSTVSILNNRISKCRTSLNLDDFNAGISVSGNTLDTCGTFISFGGTTPTNGQFTLGSNDFVTPLSAIINNSNVNTAFRIDITSSKLNGSVFNTYSTAALFGVESFMYHRGRSGRNGLVYYVAANQYVTGITTIQSAVDHAAVGDVINVKAGNYGKLTATNRTVFGAGGPYQFGLYIDKNNLTIKGYNSSDLPVTSASNAAVEFTTGATNNFGASGIFVQSDGVTLEGLKVGNNYNNSNVKDNNKTLEIVGDNFSMNKCWIATDSDEGALYMGRWDASHPVNAYSITANKFENTLVSINNGVGISGPRSGRVISNNEFIGAATPYVIGFRGWNGGSPVQGWIVDPVGGAVVTGNLFNNTTMDVYVGARGNAGGYINSELDWAEIWNTNTFGNHVVTLTDYPTFDVRTYNNGGYPESRRISLKIQENESISATGDVVLVGAGNYNEDVNITKAITLKGAGHASTVISGPIGGQASTIRISAGGPIVEGFSITRDGNNLTDWNNANLNSGGITVQSQGNYAEIRGCNIYGNRTGIDINNSNGNNIHNNIIDNNRTGLIFRNQTDNTSFTENFVRNNWTVGILFLDGSGGTNSPVQSAANSPFNDNDISGNWYGEVVDRQSGGSLPAPGTYLKNFNCNWFGAATAPTVSNSNSSEPGYSAQIPVVYGGSAVSPAPGTYADILGTASVNIDADNWLINGADNSGNTGFQPAPNACNNCGAGNPVSANVTTGNVTISTQTEMNAFFNSLNGNKWTKVVGDLTINGNSSTDPISSFCNLSSLSEVTGYLLIQQFNNVLNPTDLSYLAGIAQTGRLTIITCPSFTNISLPALTGIAGSLIIRNNRFVKTIHLSNLASIGGGQLMVMRNHRAESIQFSNTAGSFTLTNAIENCNVDVQRNGDSTANALTMDFKKITAVAENFIFSSNRNSGVSNFDNIFSGLTSVGGNLVITNNTSVAKCCIAASTVVTGSRTISGNTGNCADLTAVVSDCGALNKMQSMSKNSTNNADLLSQLNVYPNPSLGKFEIEFTTTQKGMVNIEVADFLGRILITQSKDINEGTSTIPVNMEKYAEGQYILRLELNGKVVVKRIQVVK